ncbi:hypothetical protein ACS8E3_07590 [Psychrobacter sp. 2Y5]|uniref:hypothetical protein n=1 Tax=unclassified Psychrobacter TaxID=196806 RepID=UPI003F4613C7
MLNALAIELQAQITPQTVFAMIGGLIGACALTLPKAKINGYALSAVFVFFGVLSAMVGSDLMLLNLGYDRLGAHAALGTSCGSVGGAMMMTIRAISPTFAEKLVNIAAKSVISFAESKDRIKEAIRVLVSGKDADN